ncbi:MAG: helix-turn-helix transcriptional regulator [bacterium]|nr:helix-turn-helix transcriptional regulator [bacterium]
MPFCKVELKASKPLPEAYPKRLDTIGDHIRKKRLEMKLMQSQVAEIIGVTENSITNWEKHRTTPAFWHLPKIIEFLGYVPDTITKSISGMSLGEKIVAYRKIAGISQLSLARQLGVDPCTLSKWEKNMSIPPKRFLKAIELLLDIMEGPTTVFAKA